jgi:SsrA-binding protein
MGKKKKAKVPNNTIASNRRAKHDYFIEETIEAGMVLEGWEVKSMRSGKASLSESYVIVHQGELYLHGCHISPLLSASTHISPNPTRNKKLLMHKKEISKLIGSVDRKGYTLVPVKLYWSHGRAKCLVGLGKGKKEYDKRATIKERDWQRSKARVLRHD